MTTPEIRPKLLVARSRAIALAAAWLASGCGSHPAPQVQPETRVHFEQKLGWILRLEDHRILRDPDAPGAAPAPAAPAAQASGTSGQVVFATTLPPAYGLERLLVDPDARIRRRAALAIGRVGLKAGVAPLLAALAADAEPEVRQMAAFALGLLRDPSAVAPLREALRDASPLVQGRAAEALGAIGDAPSAPAIGEMVAGTPQGRRAGVHRARRPRRDGTSRRSRRSAWACWRSAG